MGEGGKQGEDVRGQFLDDALTPVVAAAHELKSPLALIRQLSLELSDKQISPESEKIIEQIRLVAEKSLRLSTNLTKASRSQIELFPRSPVHVGQVFDEVERELSPLYKAHGRQLVKQQKPRTPLVIANKDLLRRILCNFADNALHYTDEAGVVELFMQLKRNDGLVRIGVRDHGPALPYSIWASLKSGATTPASSLHARPDSSGLGLHIASQFATTIGATIGATRHRDGATFYVDVPISKQLALL